MALIGVNGGLIGSRRIPTTDQAPGMWTANEQVLERRANTWPLPVGLDPAWASVSLLLDMNGSNGSTTFTDASTAAHSISVFGDAQVTTTSPKFGTGALLLDGNGDYLSVPSDTSLTFGTGDFTIEAWVRFNNVNTRQYIFSQRETGGFTLYLLADGRISALAPGLNAVTQASATVVVDTWHHVALTRLGTSCNIWVDGVGSPTSTFVGLNGLSGTSYIGYRGSGTTELLDGRIDDLRITKGVARYTADFTPPLAAFPKVSDSGSGSDSDWANVQMLLGMDGTNGSTTFTDSSTTGITVTTHGDVQISTAQSKFGGASGLFDGAGDYLSTATLASISPGTDAFTIEFWIRWADLAGAQTPFTFVGAFGIIKNVSNTFACGDIMTTASSLTSTTTFADNQWYHIAVSRGTGAARLYVDGVEESSVSGTNRNLSSQSIYIGRNLSPAYYFNGYIDDLRLTIGVDRYTANFTPPVAAFPVG